MSVSPSMMGVSAGARSERPESREFTPDQFCRRLLAYLPTSSVLTRLDANEALYTCGAQSNNLYLIERGCVKMLMLCQDARECLLDINTQGDLVGESCLLRAERMETVIAMTPCVLRVIPRAEFLDIIFRHRLVEESLQYLAAKLSEQRQIISHFVTADSERRLAATLLRLGRKLGKRHDGRFLAIDEKITQEELAEIVGTTRSRIGYFLKRFRAARLIEPKSQSVMMIDEARLDEYLQAWV
jgi:CRP/FNR family cyclic AMP-dependent transcriptional regulator